MKTSVPKIFIVFISLALFSACDNSSNDAKELEDGVIEQISTGHIIGIGGGAIFTQVPNAIVSLDEENQESWLVLITNTRAIAFKFYRRKPSMPFTVVFDDGNRIMVNNFVFPQDEYYCVMIEPGDPEYNDLYHAIMSSQDCCISDAFANSTLTFRIGGFRKLLKYSK